MNKGFTSKFLPAFIIFLAVFFAMPTLAFSEFDTAAKSAIIMEASTGQILYEKDADVPMPPASITKIMTLLLGFEALERGDVSWEDLVSISEKSWRMIGSRMLLEVDTKVEFGVIMTGISVVSANDGCVAIAEHLYGSENAFAQVMNQRAREIGLKNTEFKNSSGLPEEGHRMSARDIALLAQYLIDKFPAVLELESMREFTYNNVRQFNRNPLLGKFPGADGLKTGWTTEAGYCLVGTAVQNDMRLISVVLNTENETERLLASQELLNYGFRNFVLVNLLEGIDEVGQGDVQKGRELTVPVRINNQVTKVIPTGREEDIEYKLELDDEALQAPLSTETQVGVLHVLLDEEILFTTEVYPAEDVQKGGFFQLLWRSIVQFFRSIVKVS